MTSDGNVFPICILMLHLHSQPNSYILPNYWQTSDLIGQKKEKIRIELPM